MRKCSLKMKTDWKSGILIKIQNISHTNNIFVASNNVYTYYCELWSTMANVNPARGPFENFIQQNKKKTHTFSTHRRMVFFWKPNHFSTTLVVVCALYTCIAYHIYKFQRLIDKWFRAVLLSSDPRMEII